MIEGDLRDVRARARGADAGAGTSAARSAPAGLRRTGGAKRRDDDAADADAGDCPSGRSRELPNPAARAGALRRRAARIPRRRVLCVRAAADPARSPRAISEILGRTARAPRSSPNLPPDHPLEPGTRPTAARSSPSERIAASESALSEIPAGPKEPVEHVELHRRRAPRRAGCRRRAAPTNARPQRRPRPSRRPRTRQRTRSSPSGRAGTEGSSITSKIRSLLVGASVVVIVLGTFKMAMTCSTPARRRRCRRWKSRAATLLARGQERRPPCRARDAVDDLADAARPAVEQFRPRRTCSTAR